MADPTSTNVLLAQPVRGSNVGVWDVPNNGNFGAIDGLFGGQTTISLSAATTLLLSTPATGTVAASAGPNQSWNACLKITGTLTGGNSTIQLTLPHRYVFDTTGLTVGTAAMVVAPASGTGNVVGLPPGEVSEVWFDGVNVSLCGLGRIGSFLDLAVATSPVWMTVSTIPPYLPCDGSVHTTNITPALGNMLGSTFGGNGINTFGVPDFRNRFPLPIDLSGQGRVTSAGSGLDGTAMAAAGGSQFLQSHTHTATVNDSGHSHGVPCDTGGAGNLLFLRSNVTGNQTVAVTNSTTGISVTNVANGTGSSQNIPPALVFGCRFIKT